jgi:hypothetical protein
VTPGYRVRVLAEHYNPDASSEAASGLAEAVSAVLRGRFPHLTLVAYVEANPPADEVAA